MGRGFRILFAGSWLLLACFGCSKNTDNNSTNPPPVTPALSYGDSVFYLTAQSGDEIVLPVQTNAGSYSAFPDGLEINESTGAVNLSKSETGLKYRISFVPDNGGDSIHTFITVSGINFLDGFYRLNTKDSIARPVYNAHPEFSIPTNGSVFDEGSKCNSNGCIVDVKDGEINLAATVRAGVFGATPSNNDRHEFDLDYRINDKSEKAFNTIRVKLYYFDTMADVTQEVYDIISSREGTIIDARPIFTSSYPLIAVNNSTTINGSAGIAKAAKPRPPCIFIVSR